VFGLCHRGDSVRFGDQLVYGKSIHLAL
jgi:hypothetical protein